MRITSVKPQKSSNRFNIFLDGKFALGVGEDLIVDKRLLTGKEINQKELEELIFEVEAEKLMEKIYLLLNLRPRSEKEIRDYLKYVSFKRKIKGGDEISDLVIDYILQKLKQKELINDLEFARLWVTSRSKKMGPLVLKSELFKKGISKEIIDQVSSVIYQASSQEITAKILIDKKLKRWKNLPKLILRKKAIEFLLRKGFGYGLSKSLVDNLVGLKYDTEEEI